MFSLVSAAEGRDEGDIHSKGRAARWSFLLAADVPELVDFSGAKGLEESLLAELLLSRPNSREPLASVLGRPI